MSVANEKTVRDLALENPAATRVLEKLGIDYCCGGDQTLGQACQAANVPIAQVLDSLAEAERAKQPNNTDRDWQRGPLGDLIAHINGTHHKFVRDETTRLRALFEKVCSVHGKNHPELLEIRDTFSALADELAIHMTKEERILFPYIVRMEEAVVQNEPILPSPFGTVENPIGMMMHEHDSAGGALRVLRQASSGYVPPPDACLTYQTLYRALADFEADLHQHIHLENNILFPQAIEMETQH